MGNILFALALFAFYLIARTFDYLILRKIVNGEEQHKSFKIPNAIKAIKTYKVSREKKAEQEEFETMMYNIDNYNGTSLGQRDLK